MKKAMALTILTSILFLSCESIIQPQGEDFQKKNSSETFNYSTSKNIKVKIKTQAKQNSPSSNVMFNIKDGNKIVSKGLTNKNGELNAEIVIPDYKDEITIETNNLFYYGSVKVKVENGVAEYTYQQYGQKTKSIASSHINMQKISMFVPPEYNYLGGYDNQGVPDYLVSPSDNISPAMENFLNNSLPESHNLLNSHPEYIADGTETEIILEQDADVWITFIMEGATYKNALGYYTYPTNSPPNSKDEIEDLNIIYPHTSLENDGGGLNAGDKVYLGNFSAGTTIGWFLVSDGWNQTGNPYPLITAGAPDLEEEYAAVRYKSFGNTGSNEHYLGVPDLGNENRQETGYNWLKPGTYPIVFQYDPNTNFLSSIINGDSATYLDTLLSTGPDHDLNTIQLDVVERDGATLIFKDMQVNGIPLNQDFIGDSWKTWTITGFDLSKKITIRGDIEISGNFSQSSENDKVQILLGYDDNAAESGYVGWGNWTLYSNPEFNPDNKQQNVLLNYINENKIILGFEDIKRPGGDKDFNDALFHITTNPDGAIQDDDIVVPEEINDSDDDGVIDTNDDYPNDPQKAYDNYTEGTLVFEDKWPIKGDYDFNDLALSYDISRITNKDNQVTAVKLDFEVLASGARYKNGFGIEIPSLSPTNISSVSGYQLSETYISHTEGVENGQTNAVIIPFDNVYSLFSGMSYVNTGYEQGNELSPFEFSMIIELNQSAWCSLSEIGSPPFNPFMIIDGDRGKEVHLMDKSPTDLANSDLFNTGDDVSLPAEGIYYKDNIGMPWALNFSESFAYPLEKIDIREAYIDFVDWAESDGQSATDWYLFPEDSKVY